MPSRKKPRIFVTGTTTAEEAQAIGLDRLLRAGEYDLHLIGPDGKDRGPITGLVIKPGRKTFQQALKEALPPGCSIAAKR